MTDDDDTTDERISTMPLELTLDCALEMRMAQQRAWVARRAASNPPPRRERPANEPVRPLTRRTSWAEGLAVAFGVAAIAAAPVIPLPRRATDEVQRSPSSAAPPDPLPHVKRAGPCGCQESPAIEASATASPSALGTDPDAARDGPLSVQGCGVSSLPQQLEVGLAYRGR